MSDSRGAGQQPVTYVGPWNVDDLYHPLKIVTHSDATYLSVARNTGVEPGTDSATWLPLGSGKGLYVSNFADGPPTDGSWAWYVRDGTCD